MSRVRSEMHSTAPCPWSLPLAGDKVSEKQWYSFRSSGAGPRHGGNRRSWIHQILTPLPHPASACVAETGTPHPTSPFSLSTAAIPYSTHSGPWTLPQTQSHLPISAPLLQWVLQPGTLCSHTCLPKSCSSAGALLQASGEAFSLRRDVWRTDMLFIPLFGPAAFRLELSSHLPTSSDPKAGFFFLRGGPRKMYLTPVDL